MKPGTRAVLLFVGAALVLVAITTRSWVTYKGDLHAGLTSAEFCFDKGCETTWYVKDMHHPGVRELAWTLGGLGATLTGLAASILAIVGGVLLLQRRGAKALATVALILISVAVTCAFTYILALDKAGDMSWGYSVFVFFVGFAVLLTGSILALSSQAAGLVPMPPGAPPPCPTCSGGTSFVAQHRRYYCVRCNQYL